VDAFSLNCYFSVDYSVVAPPRPVPRTVSVEHADCPNRILAFPTPVAAGFFIRGNNCVFFVLAQTTGVEAQDEIGYLVFCGSGGGVGLEREGIKYGEKKKTV
jgi:hypothetical protein